PPQSTAPYYSFGTSSAGWVAVFGFDLRARGAGGCDGLPQLSGAAAASPSALSPEKGLRWNEL
ncbi:MAG TPA: hypothetical protein VGG72_09085, partial [Bryobacteraceae bacterium]